MHWKRLLAAGVVWGIAAGTASADLYSLFSSPLPPGPGTVIPCGGPLAAPVITPTGVKHGENVFDMTPAGWNRETFSTRAPGRYINNSCDDPYKCSADRVGWVTLEYLYWATQGPSAPPLVTTGPAVLGPGVAGAIGQPATQPLLGGERVLNGLRSGFRIEAGAWLDDGGQWAASHRFFYLGSRSEQLAGGSDGTNVVNLPQVFSLPGGPVQVPLYVGFPGLTRGTVTSSVQTQLFGGDTVLRRALRAGDAFRFDLIGGYRFVHLGDSLADSFDVVSATLPGPLSPRLMGEDSVRTRNDFHGGQVGFATTGRSGRFTVEMRSTIALGVTVSDLDQSRTRALFGGFGPAAGLPAVPGLPVPGAPPLVLAAHNQSDYFAVVPELGVKFGWEPINHVRLTFGYDLLYWSRVRRAQELYALGPTLRTDTTDFWAQGLSLGMELRY
ncbi:MAG: hypothetical protein JWO38_6677 [Gemmataceae bacterium]|nr:hypothetical protein [Gemmataceae bacterium]